MKPKDYYVFWGVLALIILGGQIHTANSLNRVVDVLYKVECIK